MKSREPSNIVATNSLSRKPVDPGTAKSNLPRKKGDTQKKVGLPCPSFTYSAVLDCLGIIKKTLETQCAMNEKRGKRCGSAAKKSYLTRTRESV